MKFFEKINVLSKGKRVTVKIVLFILIWNIVLLPVFLVVNNCSDKTEKKWFFEEAEQFIRESSDFYEQYGNILTIEYEEVKLDKEINKTVAVLNIKTEKYSSLECTVVYEQKTIEGGAVYPSYYTIK